MARNSFLSSTRRRGSISFGFIMIQAASRKNPGAMCGEVKRRPSPWPPPAVWKKTGSASGPAGIAAGFAQGLFHVADALLDLVDFLFLGRDLGVFFVYILAAVLLGERLLGIAVILHLRFVVLALQDIELFFSAVQAGISIPELLAPLRLGTFLVFGGLGGVLCLSAGILGRILGSGWGIGGATGRAVADVVVGIDFLRLSRFFFLLLAGPARGIRHRVAGGFLSWVLLLGARRKRGKGEGQNREAYESNRIAQNPWLHRHLQEQTKLRTFSSLCCSFLILLFRPGLCRTAVA